MIGIVDADSIYFRAVMTTTNKKEIRKIINSTMTDIQGQCFCTESDLMVAVKGHDNFRKILYPQYKANRPAQPDNIKKALNYAHDYMKNRWNAVEATGMEADDLVSIWAREARNMGEDYVIIGLDKDLLQIPGYHYNFKRSEHAFIDSEMGNYNLMSQCLTGDTSDNIPGIKGVGPKRAEAILQGVPDSRRWNRVRAAWRARGAGDPSLTYKLVRMLTSWDEFDEVRKECEQKKTEGSTRGRSASELTASPSPSTQPTSESEEVTL